MKHHRSQYCLGRVAVAVAGMAFLAVGALRAEPESTATTAEATQKLQILPAATAPLPGHFTGGFAGMIGRTLVAGVDVTSTGGAVKVFSLPMDHAADAAWTDSNLLVAQWSASAGWHDSILVVGGLDDGPATNPIERTLSDRVSVLGLQDGKVAVTGSLPKLPKPLAGAGAAVIKDRLYVFGGVSAMAPLTLEKALYSLDLKNPAAGWQEEAPFPGAGRAFATVVAQYDSLCVLGGMVAQEDASKPATTSQETWLFKPRPWEASLDLGWLQLTRCPQALVGASAFPAGQSSVVVAGGYDLPAAGSIWPRPSSAVAAKAPLVFNLVTDAWCPFDQPLGFSGTATTTYPAEFTPRFFILGSAPSESTGSLTEIKILRTAQNLSWLDYLVIFFYFAFIAGIGMVASRKQKSSSDFSLAGRSVPWWVAGISMFATGASAISFMAIPALAFATNLVFTFPVLTLLVAFFVQSRIIYPLLRRMEITSTYEYLERRFNLALRLIASAQCIMVQTFGRASVVLLLPSLAISATTGMQIWLCVLLMWAITTVYTTMGGFKAVVWTDVFQGTLKFFAPIFMILVGIFSLPHGLHQFMQISESHHKFQYALFTWDYTAPAIWILFISTFLQNTIQQAGDQPVIQRVFSSPEKEVRRVAAMFITCGILIATVVNFLGISIFSYFHAFPAKLDPLTLNDKIVPLFVVQALPHGVVGVIIAAIFASAMTTVASAMNSSATVFTEDFYLRWYPKATDKNRLLVLRVSSVIVGLTATSIALYLSTIDIKSLMQTWNIISALLGGGIVGVFSLGMFTKRANGFGAVAGAILSIIITACAHFLTPVHWQALIPIAILSCMICGYLCSLPFPQNKDLKGLTVYR